MNAKLKKWEKLIVMGYKLLLDIPYFLKICLYTTTACILSSIAFQYEELLVILTTDVIYIQNMLRFTLSIKYLKEIFGMSLN